jgi:hypothetical protein
MKDEEHLNLLSVFHYVVAGLGAMFSLIPVLHVVLGLGMVTGKLPDPQNDPMVSKMGWLFVIFGSVFISFGLGFAGCLAAAGRFLSRRKHYTYCLVMSGLACAFMPFGTVLGVFTIVVLQRDSVKQLFGRVPSKLPGTTP